MPTKPSRPVIDDIRSRGLARRSVLAGVAAGCLARRAGAADSPTPSVPQIIVAGPGGGRLDRWAASILPALSRALPGLPAIRKESVGGVDGVTGANRFAAAGDGESLLLVPGQAATAWLAGDPRARFDAAHWVPVLGAASPGVLASRYALDDSRLGHGARIAASTPSGEAMPALLALDLAGIPLAPVFGLTGETAIEAFDQGSVDLVFLDGANVPARLARLVGARPVLTVGACTADGMTMRDPIFPDVPHMAERFAPAAPADRVAAWRATAAASRLAFGLMLSRATPAASVALWRRAGAQAVTAPEVEAVSAAATVRPMPPEAVEATTRGIAASQPALIALRGWLSARWDWRPA